MTETLAPLLVKWLTHDFATPIATVMTASELLGDTPDPEINDLVVDAARRLAGRLQLVRAALAPSHGPVGAPGIDKLLRTGLVGTPVTITLAADQVFDAPVAAVITSAAMLLADLRRFEPLYVTAHSALWQSSAAMPDAVIMALSGGDPTDARSAVAAMLASSAARAGLSLQHREDGLSWD